jgi:uncharacterized protein (TIGR03790 family)
MSFRVNIVFPLLILFLFPLSSFALQPDELLLIVNSRVAESLQLAEYYQARRKIPSDQILRVSMTNRDDCSRSDYLSQLAQPVRDFLEEHPEKNIHALVLFYGLPLRVAAPKLTVEQQQQLENLTRAEGKLQRQLAKHELTKVQIGDYKTALKQTVEQIKLINGRESGAAIDSEIALVKAGDYPLDMWLENPFFIGYQNQKERLTLNKDQVLQVARLDGPDSATVRRMIDDSLTAERIGLQGNAYFDARWPQPQKQKLTGYALYDASLHRAAALTRKISLLNVVVDQYEALFSPGSAPDAALYSGWYSLGNYVDAFDWKRGAVGYHIASSECTTLKKTEGRGWCKSILEDGAAATIGPVAEPYVQGFPLPEVFFGMLLDGYYTLSESYILSLPYLSWQMILIGDPLYRPFRNLPSRQK